MTKRIGQEGAALIVVLLLLATLSFIVLGLSEKMAFAAERSVSARARAEAMWRAFGVEALAAAAIAEAARETPEVMTLDEPWIERPISAPMEGGVATIWFEDATRCFNLNSLVEPSGEGALGPRASGAAELVATLTAAGATGADSEMLAAVVTDWIDADGLAEARGAEDSVYISKKTPYRTGGVLLADKSEVRAMAEIGAEFYRALGRLVCVLPTTEPAPININMLRAADAPLLAGLAGGAIGVAEARDIISARPPGGYRSLDDFWAHPAFAGLEVPEATKNRVRLTSAYIEARAEVAYEGAVVNAALVYALDGAGAARLISRRWGTDL